MIMKVLSIFAVLALAAAAPYYTDSVHHELPPGHRTVPLELDGPIYPDDDKDTLLDVKKEVYAQTDTDGPDNDLVKYSREVSKRSAVK